MGAQRDVCACSGIAYRGYVNGGVWLDSLSGFPVLRFLSFSVSVLWSFCFCQLCRCHGSAQCRGYAHHMQCMGERRQCADSNAEHATLPLLLSLSISQTCAMSVQCNAHETGSTRERESIESRSHPPFASRVMRHVMHNAAQLKGNGKQGIRERERTGQSEGMQRAQ